MDFLFYLFVILAFVAVVSGLEGAFLFWNAYQGADARKIQQRLRTAAAAEGSTSATPLFRDRRYSESPAMHRMLARIPRIDRLDHLLIQAGDRQSVGRFLGLSAGLGFLGLFVPLILHVPFLLALGMGILAALLPLLQQFSARKKRWHKVEEQLPDALDLICRALRAGHAFTSTIQMVGKEATDPIAAEFRRTFEEINFGSSVKDGLTNLATRVPSTDLRYFVIAVLIQRETGGNLAELLGSLSMLIRERFKLLGTIRVLSAEGRLSAWILTGLPFCVAAVVYLLNPEYMSVLWTDPAGLKIVIGMSLMMCLGIFWMQRIIKIRV